MAEECDEASVDSTPPHRSPSVRATAVSFALLYHENPLSFIFTVLSFVSVHECVRKCTYSQRTEASQSPVSGATGSCELQGMEAGN